ncbi:hypothetical protein FM107_20475 [Sphingobacterium sp. JB170]|nr:hypothetical protein FM107_20475 [Sphingobacterium sp. JB170]
MAFKIAQIPPLEKRFSIAIGDIPEHQTPECSANFFYVLK